MNAAYVDTSVLICLLFGESGGDRMQALLSEMDVTLASNFLEAELRSTVLREQVEVDVGRWLAAIRWIYPNRRLSAEIERVLRTGYVRGADLWHLACALFISPDPSAIWFLTLDERQSSIAEKVGFRVRS